MRPVTRSSARNSTRTTARLNPEHNPKPQPGAQPQTLPEPQPSPHSCGTYYRGAGETRQTATKHFPENVFNPLWTPYLPELKPAFAEIAIHWEDHYKPACLAELVLRLAAHVHRVTGVQSLDTKSVKALMMKEEEEDLKMAYKSNPFGSPPLGWDWKQKSYDVFLSHKITDAKDVVLTWYNAFSALGYNPFLDRLSLDAVENIPKYVEQTVTFIVAVTSNLHESYWCAKELAVAVDLHADGQINILHCPVQGEEWYSSTGE